MSNTYLLDAAKEVWEKAYVPYSKFRVGAAILTKSGNVYQGCNIENSAFPVTCCAERVAIFKAISEGEREFSRLAVVADTDRPVPPCGSCRQVLSEFCDPKMEIEIANLKGDVKVMTMEELLPFSFTPKDLSSGQEK